MFYDALGSECDPSYTFRHPLVGSTGRYLDVRVASASALGSLTVQECQVRPGDFLAWWDPAVRCGAVRYGAVAWQRVTPSAIHKGSGCEHVTLSRSSSPPLAQLTGTVLAVAAEAMPVRR